MKYFDSGNRVSQDACALETRNRENQSINDYLTYNFYEAPVSCDQLGNKLNEIAMQNPNLTYRIGYGYASPCVIDNDSKMRFGADLTHGPERRNLCTRNFVAGPNLSRGESQPHIESALINGVNTFSERDCHKLAETPLGVFAPLTPCVEKYIMGAAEVIHQDLRIGRPSKDIFLAQRQAC